MAGVELGGTFGSRVVIDGQALAQLLRGPDGPVFRQLTKAGDVVKDGAMRRAPVWRPSAGEPDWSIRRRTSERRPGTLRDSIVKRVVEGGPDGFAILVGSEDDVALFVHEGTEPHQITPLRAPQLVFWWARIRSTVRADSVFHPGTRPQRFLTDSLADLRGMF